MGGFNGCNEFGGRWEIHGKQLDVGGIGQTLILCRGDAAMVERRMNKILGASPTITLSKGDLRLTALPEGVLIFRLAGR